MGSIGGGGKEVWVSFYPCGCNELGMRPIGSLWFSGDYRAARDDKEDDDDGDWDCECVSGFTARSGVNEGYFFGREGDRVVVGRC